MGVLNLRRCICHFIHSQHHGILEKEGEHMDHLRVVLHVHKENKPFTKYIKCEFLLRAVTFFGYIICSEGVEVYPRKTQALKNWPRPLKKSISEDFWV